MSKPHCFNKPFYNLWLRIFPTKMLQTFGQKCFPNVLTVTLSFVKIICTIVVCYVCLLLLPVIFILSVLYFNMNYRRHKTLDSSLINTVIYTTTTKEGGTEVSCGSPVGHYAASLLFKANHYPEF